MPGVNLATAFSISLRFIDFNALQKSNRKIREEIDEVSTFHTKVKTNIKWLLLHPSPQHLIPGS